MKNRILIILGVLFLVVIGFFVSKNNNLILQHEIGQKIDELNGVAVYYNGGVGNVSGREVSDDGYNIGLKYQCVEFVKRYYYEQLNPKKYHIQIIVDILYKI